MAFAAGGALIATDAGPSDTASDEFVVRDWLLGSNRREGNTWRRTRSSSWHWYLNREPDLKGGGMGIVPTANPLPRQEFQQLAAPVIFPPVLPKLSFLCPLQSIFRGLASTGQRLRRLDGDASG